MAAGRPGRPSNAEKAKKHKELSERQWAYVLWLSKPSEFRDPSSKAELARMIGVSHQTLNNWDQQEYIGEAVRRLVLRNAGDPTRITRVVDIVFEEIVKTYDAGKTDMKAVDLFSRMVGINDAWKKEAPTVEIDNSTHYDLKEMSDAELQEIYDRLAGEAAENEAVVRATLAE